MKRYHTKKSSQPRKESLTEDTWKLVCEKRTWKSHLKEAQRLQDRTFLQLVFSQWKDNANATANQCRTIQLQLREQDHLVATAWAQFRQLRRDVVRAVRADDIAFYDRLTRESSDHLHPSEARQFWRTIRRSLPKHRQRRLQPPPLQLEAMEDRWIPHFEEIEAGQTTSLPSILQACFDQHVVHSSCPAPVEIQDLPSLQQFESALRAVKSGKATGLDPFTADFYHNNSVHLAKLYYPLLLKIFQFQCEPATWKGGILAVLPKVGDPQRVTQFRGIMLLHTVAKSVHALLRTRLLPLLGHNKPPGQIGGFPKQEVMFGSQHVQMFGRIAASHHMSTGVLFIDLQQAFHRLIREAVTGIEDHQDLQVLFLALDPESQSSDRIRELLKLPAVLDKIGAPPYLVKLLRDVHQSTWFTLDQRRFTQTHRGTRPGSPLADIIFHAIMRDAADSIQHWLEQQHDLQAHLEQLDIELHPIIWADDVAVPVCTPDACNLVPLISKLLSAILNIFHDKGFRLNLAHGKTAAVLSFRGTNAPQLRKQFLLVPHPGVECDSFDGQKVWLHFEPTYRHLGTQFSSELNLNTELQHRIGQATSAFQQLSRPLLTNRHLPVALRLRLFRALISTRLFFGAGAWHTPILCGNNRSFAEFGPDFSGVS